METPIEAMVMCPVMAVDGATEDWIVDAVQDTAVHLNPDMAVDMGLVILLQKILFFLLLEQAHPLPLKCF